MKRPFLERLGTVLEEKGFYIALLLCAAALGISGYHLLTDGSSAQAEAPVVEPVTVTVRPTPAERSVTPQKPQVSATPRPTARPRPSATAAPSPSPLQTPDPEAAAPAFSVRPVEGEVLTPFSTDTLTYSQTMGDWRTHEGLDLTAELGTPVAAAAEGTVRAVQQDELMGTIVTVEHTGGLVSVYANLSTEPVVESGNQVQAGDVLGTVGGTAAAESADEPHLHFALLKDGQPVDPADYLPTA